MSVFSSDMVDSTVVLFILHMTLSQKFKLHNTFWQTFIYMFLVYFPFLFPDNCAQENSGKNMFWYYSSALPEFKKLQKKSLILGLTLISSNISMHILHTVLYTFPKVLTRRISLTIQSFCSHWSFSLFSWP